MWDRSRLDALGMFAVEWDGAKEDRRSSDVIWIPPDENPREWIFENGGRGWWAPGDTSRVVWTGKISEV